jgi:paraquat-inducible protein A
MIACRECDCLQQEVEVPSRGAALCARCGMVLYRSHYGSLDHTLAFLISAAILFVIANSVPLVSLDAQGLRTSTTIYGTAHALYLAGEPTLAILVFMTAILFPAVEIVAVLSMLVPLRLGFVPRGLPLFFRAVHAVEPWSMVSVFMLGVLVSMVKLAHIATVNPGMALYALGGFIMLLAAAEASFDSRALWARVQACGP